MTTQDELSAQHLEERDSALGQLMEAAHHLHPDRLSDAVRPLLARLGGDDAVIYIADYNQRTLVPLDDDHEPTPVDDGPIGQAYREETEVAENRPDGRVRLSTPLMDGAQRVGVLSLTVRDASDRSRLRFRRIAARVAELVVVKEAYGDAIELRRRRRPMDLAAELRWATLPPLTFTTSEVTITGILEPAYEIAGDTFDYSIHGGIAHLALMDAMGHGLEASRMANLAVAAYRQSRREDVGLSEMYRAVDSAIGTTFGESKYVTGHFATLELQSGRLRWLNAGHPRPLLLRDGAVSDLPTEPNLPLGLGEEREVIVAESELEPDDAVLFFTDGITDALNEAGEELGRDRFAELFGRVYPTSTPAETNRLLAKAVLEHSTPTLRDDATQLLVVWHGRPPEAIPEPA